MEPTPLLVAVNSNDAQKVAEVLANDGHKYLNSAMKGDFPIHTAAKNRNVKILELLVEAGANVNQGSEEQGSMNGYTAAHYASRNGDVDMLLSLKNLKADFERPASDGWCPIHCAAFGGKKQALITLLDKCRVDVNTPNQHGHTAIVYASSHGRPQDVRELLRRGAKIDGRDSNGDTLVHHAFHYQMSKLFEGEYDVPEIQLDVGVLLAMHGIDETIKNNEGMTGTHYMSEGIPSLNKVLAILRVNKEFFAKSGTDWNYMTLLSGRIEHFKSMGLDMKHVVDLVENLKNVETERLADKKQREADRPAGGCPVMRGKKKKPADVDAEAARAKAAGEDPSEGACPFFKKEDETPKAAAIGPPVGAAPSHADPHAGIDVTKVDPNGPDPSGGQCPFFKGKPGLPARKEVPTAAAPTKAVAPQQYTPATTHKAGTVVELLMENKNQVVALLLAFFVGMWVEQTMVRVFGR